MMRLGGFAVGLALLGAMVSCAASQGVVKSDSSTSACGTIASRATGLQDFRGDTYPGFRSSFDFSCLPGATSAAMYTRTMKSAGPGTYVSGVWSVDHMFSDTASFDRRAISQVWGGNYDFNSIGDKALLYWYAHFFGGMVAYSDEGIEPVMIQAVQEGYPLAKVNSIADGSDGTMDVVTSAPACMPVGSGGCVAREGGAMFADGGYLFDRSRPLTRAMTVASSSGARVLDSLVLTVDGAPLKVSSAWGYANAATCTHNAPGGGRQQVYGEVTCSLRLNGRLNGTPASPGSFVAGVPTCAVGSFEEQVQVTSVGLAFEGVQPVTFRARNPWFFYGKPILMMQGGPCGSLAVQDGKWPMGWPVVGAFTSSELVFGNCHNGYCSGGTTGVLPGGPKRNSFQSSGTLRRMGGVVTLTVPGYPYSATYSYPVGSTVVLQGWTPEDLNGTYTVTANTMDAYDIRIQWKQAGTDESSMGQAGKIGGPHPALTLYPSAEILGTDGGQLGHAQLATNRMRDMGMAAGDTVIGAPTTEYQSNGINYIMAQTTPNDPGTSSDGLNITDAGVSPVGAMLRVFNAGKTPGYSMMQAAGSWVNDFLLSNRPADNGYIIHVQGNEPVSPNVKPYFLFADTRTYANLSVNPADSSIHSGYSFVVDGGAFRVGRNANAYFERLGGAAGSVLTVGKNGVVTAGVATHLRVDGPVTAAQIIAGGKMPMLTADSDARCTVMSGTNMAGVISCTTGSMPVADKTLARVRFAGELTVAPQGCLLMARNANAAGASVSVYTTAPSTTGWTIAVGNAGLKEGMVYRWSYACM